MKRFYITLTGVFIFSAIATIAQKTDTVIITGENVNTKVLQSGTHCWLVYFRMGKDSSRTRYQLWTRKIDFINYSGREAISITQEWEDNDSVMHKVYSVSDRKSFVPLFHESWWRGRGATKFDFIKKEGYVRDTLLTDADTAKAKKNMLLAFREALKQDVWNWHLDLETFPILPYKDNTTFLINFYDPGFPAPKLQAYTVSGSAKLKGFDNQEVDCWLLTHNTSTGSETFWISKKTKEVLKLEQEFGGRYRYKIKLGFSV